MKQKPSRFGFVNRMREENAARDQKYLEDAKRKKEEKLRRKSEKMKEKNGRE